MGGVILRTEKNKLDTDGGCDVTSVLSLHGRQGRVFIDGGGETREQTKVTSTCTVYRIRQVFPSHNIFLLPRVFFGFLDLCVRVLEVHVFSWVFVYFYLRFEVTQIFNEEKKSDIFWGG